uniref:paralemmin 1a n=1 Tax=Epinephelus lanceolatus TaxID=310571 RepID=UPI0014452179|nr:paralemmin 1a [Epinephelus lanceolatus]
MEESQRNHVESISEEPVVNMVTGGMLEAELVGLESGGLCQRVEHTTVSSGSVKAVEVKGHSSRQQTRPATTSGQIVQEVKVHKNPRVNKPKEATDEMKRAMYSVEIKVERDKVTGETRVLSTNTTLPVDLSHQGVKVYEDERKGDVTGNRMIKLKPD